MFLCQAGQTLTDASEIRALCDPCGIEIDAWDVSGLTTENAHRAAVDIPTQQDVLARFQGVLDDLKARKSYLTEDIVCLSAETPGLAELLAKFDQPHHHTDDEVRIVLAGEGVFGIVPQDAPPFEIHMCAGDMINVPAFTRHWFTLTDLCHIIAIRVFKTPAGWTAIYEAEAVSA